MTNQQPGNVFFPEGQPPEQDFHQPMANPPAMPEQPMPVASLTAPVQNYKLLSMTQAERDRHHRAINTNMRGRASIVRNFPRITMPGPNTKVWQIPGAHADQIIPFFDGIIIHTTTPRAWYPEDYAPGRRLPPSCASIDSVTGYGDNGTGSKGPHKCFTCPKNQFGTAKVGQGKACPEHINVFVITPTRNIPVIVQIPPTSFKNFDGYLNRLMEQGQPYDTVVTRFQIKSGQGASWIDFQMVEPLSDPQDQMLQSISQALVTLVAADEAQRRQEAESNAGPIDMGGITHEAEPQERPAFDSQGNPASQWADDDPFSDLEDGTDSELDFAPAYAAAGAPAAAGRLNPEMGV